MATEDEIRRLILEVVGEKDVEKLAESVKKTDASLDGLDRTSKTYNRNVTALSYALQDFAATSGDLGAKLNSITNNIDGILAGLTKYAGLVGIVVTAGVALYRNWDLLTLGAEKAKEKQDALSESLKRQKEEAEKAAKAFKEFYDLQAPSAIHAEKSRAEQIKEALAPDLQATRKATAEAIAGEAAGEIARLGPELQALAAGPAAEYAARGPGIAQRLERQERIRRESQQRADELLQRATTGDAAALQRLRGFFPQETGLGARLAEASPGRAQERAEEERDVAGQHRQARLQDQLNKQKEQQAQKTGQMMGQAFQEEEQDLQRQRQADQHAAQEKQRAAQREEQARKRIVAARENEAARAEREGIENVRFQVEQAIGAGAPAGMVAQQANAMLNKIAMTSGRTTNLVQAQGRLMLHLQQVAERQQRQLEAAERDLQRGWDNAFRRGK